MTPFPSSIEMKDSGIPWVGLIPSSWDMKRAKFLFSLAQRPPHPDDGIVTAFRDGQVTLRSNRRTDGFTNALKETGYQRVHKGDLVIHAMDAFAGAIGVSDSDGKCTPVYSCCIPSDEASSEFYARCVRTMSTTGFIESLSKGIRERSTDFRWATFAEQLLPHPPKAEQDAIVAYLDRATTRIDTLVAKKTRFIELLREKRQALITHAVTKGLDPNMPMKDSGVEWLGKIPAHWKVVALKRLGRLKGGNGFPPGLQGRPDNEIPFFKVGDLGKSPDGQHLGATENTITQSDVNELGAMVFPIGSLAWAKIGAALSLNRRRILTKPSCLDNNMTGFIPDPTVVSTRFGFYLMNAVDFTVHAKPGAVPSFSEGDQGELMISLPPSAVQSEIVTHLDRVTSRIDTLIAKTERSIELLREHRTALITAAVTGKIDLSN